MISSPVFLCGALRSGSSMTHLILDNHPEVNNPGEFDFLFELVSNDGQFPSTMDYADWLSINRIFQSKSLKIDPSLSFLDLINSFIAQKTQAGSCLVLNIHRNFDRIPYVFPDAKFIHLIRDPRDVARSSIGMGWAGSVYYGVDHWIDTEESWQRLSKTINTDQFIEVQFEELILAPEKVLKEVCDFLGVMYSDSMLNYADNSTYSAPDPSLVYQWKKKLSAREIQLVESKAHYLMKSLGYALSGEKIQTIGGIEKLQLKVMNKLFRVTFNIKRHGLLLVLQNRFARLLGLEALTKKTVLKINEIDKQYLE